MISIYVLQCNTDWRTGIRGLMRGMATLPQGNQVRDKVGKPPGELGVSKSLECDIFPSVLWHCWLGDRKDIRPVKKLDVGLLVMMIWLELCTSY